jgi:nicotinamide-nucleotide amidase
MNYMWDNEVLPRLRQKATGVIIFSKTIKTFGISESTVGEMVSPLFSSANPTLGIYAKTDGIHLRLTAKAQTQQEAEKIIAPSVVKLKEILGEAVWGADDETLTSVVGQTLTEKGLSLAVMEGCTGGLLVSTITEALDASDICFKGGLIANSDEVLIAYGIDAGLISSYGTVSAEVAQAMAEVARSRFRADIGIGITGIVGSEALEGKLGGTAFIGIDDGKNKRIINRIYPTGDKSRVKLWVTNGTLFELRKVLLTLS